MEIYINEQLLDYKMEKEKNLMEVYEAIHRWVQSQNKFLMNSLYEGREVTPEHLSGISVQEGGRLDIYIGEELDILRSGLDELDRYIDTVGNTLLGRDSLTEKESTDLQDGIVWISQVMSSAEIMLKLDFQKIRPLGTGKNVREILESLKSISKSLDSLTSIEEFLENLRDMKLFVMDLLQRTTTMDMDAGTLSEIIRTFAENMEVLKTEFARVNENFQSGKDAVANELLNHSVGRLNLLLTGLISLQGKRPDLKINEISHNEMSFDEMTNGLNDILALIAKALEENDIVHAGDLLEYELPGVLDELRPFLQVIHKRLGENSKN